MQESSNTSDPRAEVNAKSWRPAVAAISVMVIAFALVVIFRHEIRVRWWGYRLTHSSATADRLYYIPLLAQSRERALPVADQLLANDDPAMRSISVAILNSIPGEDAFALLRRAGNDANATVRESAIFGLSVRDDPHVIAVLREFADHPDITTAMIATSRLDTHDHETALDTLSSLATSHPQAGIRAQAIQSLSQWDATDIADTLIACLADDAVFEKPTATERAIRETLAFAAPQMAGQLQADPATGLFGPIGEANSLRAARVLRTVTSENFGFLEASPPEREAAIDAWRNWRHKKLQTD